MGKGDRWKISTNKNMILFDKLSKKYVWLDPPNRKTRTIEKLKQLIFMNLR